MEHGDSSPPAPENVQANPSGGPPEKRPPLTGDAGCLLGGLLLFLGAGMFAFWFLFMSWSHSYSSPSFQQQEELTKFGATILVLAGAIILARWWSARPPTSNPKP